MLPGKEGNDLYFGSNEEFFLKLGDTISLKKDRNNVDSALLRLDLFTCTEHGDIT